VCHGIQGANVRVDGDLILDGLRTRRGVQIRSAIVKGGLFARNAVLHTDGDQALDARALEVSGEARLDGLRANATINLRGAKVGPLWSLRKAVIDAPDTPAVNARSVEVRGSVLLAHADCRGIVDLLEARVGGSLMCDNARFRSGDHPDASMEPALRNCALLLERGRVEGAVLFGPASCDPCEEASADQAAPTWAALCLGATPVPGGVHNRLPPIGGANACAQRVTLFGPVGVAGHWDGVVGPQAPLDQPR